MSTPTVEGDFLVFETPDGYECRVSKDAENVEFIAPDDPPDDPDDRSEDDDSDATKITDDEPSSEDDEETSEEEGAWFDL